MKLFETIHNYKKAFEHVNSFHQPLNYQIPVGQVSSTRNTKGSKARNSNYMKSKLLLDSYLS